MMLLRKECTILTREYSSLSLPNHYPPMSNVGRMICTNNPNRKQCMFGFHASKEIKDAIRYCSGDHLVEVELGGNIIEVKGKIVASEITILRELDLIEELETLSKDEDWRVREAVARNPNIPVKIFKKLARDKDACVRRGIIENPNTPYKIRRALMADKFWGVSTWQQIVEIVRSMINI